MRIRKWNYLKVKLFNRSFPSSKNPHFQKEAKCTSFLVKMSFICMRIKNHFHIKGWAHNLVLIQRPRRAGKWPILQISFMGNNKLQSVFWYFVRSWRRIIQVNLRNPAKFIRNQHIWNLSRSMGWIIIAVNLQIYLEFSSPQQANNFPKLPGINYAAKNLRLVMMLKALPLAHF